MISVEDLKFFGAVSFEEFCIAVIIVEQVLHVQITVTLEMRSNLG